MKTQNEKIEFVADKKFEADFSGIKLSFDTADTTLDSVYESDQSSVDLASLALRANGQDSFDVFFHRGWRCFSKNGTNVGWVDLKVYVVCVDENNGLSLTDLVDHKQYVTNQGELEFQEFNGEWLDSEKNQFDLTRFSEQCVHKCPLESSDISVFDVNAQKWLCYEQGVPGESPIVVFGAAISARVILEFHFDVGTTNDNFYNPKIPIKTFFEDVIKKTMTSTRIEYPKNLGVIT